MRVTMAHASLQFSDNARQKRSDVEKIFDRAVEKSHWWVTGTESGEQPLIGLVRNIAREHCYRVHRWRGNWIAVDKRRIESGSWRKGHIFVAPTAKVHGPGHDSGFPWVNFTNDDLGRLAVAAVHYPTKGRRPGDPNYHINRLYAQRLGAWGKRHGKGRRLAFVQGDVNILDNRDDVFHGQPFTTAWDEREKWPNTGHGTIDIIASYDKDGRVEARMARALNDRKFHLHSDHFMIEAGYDIRPLRAA